MVVVLPPTTPKINGFDLTEEWVNSSPWVASLRRGEENRIIRRHHFHISGNVFPLLRTNRVRVRHLLLHSTSLPTSPGFYTCMKILRKEWDILQGFPSWVLQNIIFRFSHGCWMLLIFLRSIEDSLGILAGTWNLLFWEEGKVLTRRSWRNSLRISQVMRGYNCKNLFVVL